MQLHSMCSRVGLGLALLSACANDPAPEEAVSSAPALANSEFREIAAADWALESGAEKYSDGRLPDAQSGIERLRESGDIAGGLGMVWLYCEFLMLEAKADREALERLVQHSDVAMLERVTPQRAAGAFAWVTALAARLGHAAKARVFLARTQSFDIPAMPMAAGDLCVLCGLADAYASLGDASCAEGLYAQLAPYQALNAVGGAMEYLGSVAHYLGMLALLLGQPTAAVEHLQAAIAFNAKLPNPALRARSQELLAEARARAEQLWVDGR